MQPEDFGQVSPRQLVRNLERVWVFIPNPLPPSLIASTLTSPPLRLFRSRFLTGSKAQVVGLIKDDDVRRPIDFEQRLGPVGRIRLG
jgi:hypothetical protein